MDPNEKPVGVTADTLRLPAISSQMAEVETGLLNAYVLHLARLDSRSGSIGLLLISKVSLAR
jgi:hypothetical protein